MQTATHKRLATWGCLLAMLAALGSSGCSMFSGSAEPAELPGMSAKSGATNPQYALQSYEEEVAPAQYEQLTPHMAGMGPGMPAPAGMMGPGGPPPAALNMVTLPPYRLEPPDVLLISVLGMVPKNPYELQPNDILQIVVRGTPPEDPIAGTYLVEPSGVVTLGPSYGSVRVAGLTSEEAADAISESLQRDLQFPETSVTVVQMAGQQEIIGEHIITPDGSVNLGVYGSVFVTGMTLNEAKAEIEQHLSQYLESPRVSLDIFAYNSKVCYVVTSGAGLGDTITAIPITGNDTVLGALSRIGGLNQLTSTNMWVARPAPPGAQCDQILPVDYVAITQGGSTATNYQLFPNDVLYVDSDRFVRLEQRLAKIIGPVERLLGVTLFGGQTVQLLQRFPRGNQNQNF